MTEVGSTLSYMVVTALFGLGLLGVLIRRNAIIVLMCIELMLNAGNLLLVVTAMQQGRPDGILFVVFVITIAAAEVAVGLGILLNLYRLKGNVDLISFTELKG